MSLECKSNVRYDLDVRKRVDAVCTKLSERMGDKVERERFLRIALKDSLPIYEAETQEEFEKAVKALRIRLLSVGE